MTYGCLNPMLKLTKMIMNKNNYWLLIMAVLFAATILATIVHNKKGPGKEKNPGTSSSVATPPSLSVKTFQNKEGWGYEIFVDGQRFIYQDQIPGAPGKQSFVSQQEAMLCGELVIKKIKENNIPSIHSTELDSLNITYLP